MAVFGARWRATKPRSLNKGFLDFLCGDESPCRGVKMHDVPITLGKEVAIVTLEGGRGRRGETPLSMAHCSSVTTPL